MDNTQKLESLKSGDLVMITISQFYPQDTTVLQSETKTYLGYVRGPADFGCVYLCPNEDLSLDDEVCVNTNTDRYGSVSIHIRK